MSSYSYFFNSVESVAMKLIARFFGKVVPYMIEVLLLTIFLFANIPRLVFELYFCVVNRLTPAPESLLLSS